MPIMLNSKKNTKAQDATSAQPRLPASSSCRSQSTSSSMLDECIEHAAEYNEKPTAASPMEISENSEGVDLASFRMEVAANSPKAEHQNAFLATRNAAFDKRESYCQWCKSIFPGKPEWDKHLKETTHREAIKTWKKTINLDERPWEADKSDNDDKRWDSYWEKFYEGVENGSSD